MQPTAAPHPLIAVDELARLLEGGPAPTLLDVRYRMGGPPGGAEFERGHVPGAAYVDLDGALAAPPGDGGRHPLPDPVDLQAALRAAGVREGRPVVVYDDWQGRAAARCWWLLRWAGHGSVRVLDGGWGAWTGAGHPVATGAGAPEPGDLVVRPGSVPTVGPEEVLDVAARGLLLDAREAPRYAGETEPVDPVAGHMPGAVNAPTTANHAPDGRLRSRAELAEVYAAARGRETAVYCGSGVTAAHDLLAMAVAGLDGALYPGSWSEWVRDPARPVATGPTPSGGVAEH